MNTNESQFPKSAVKVFSPMEEGDVPSHEVPGFQEKGVGKTKLPSGRRVEAIRSDIDYDKYGATVSHPLPQKGPHGSGVIGSVGDDSELKSTPGEAVRVAANRAATEFAEKTKSGQFARESAAAAEKSIKGLPKKTIKIRS